MKEEQTPPKPIEEPDEAVLLTPEEEAKLWEAAEQIRRGEWVDGDELLNELRERARRVER